MRLIYCLVIFPSLIEKKGEELGWVIDGKPAVDPYSSIARNILVGRGYVDDTGRINYARLPGYVFFLSLIYKLWGFELWKVQVIQSLLDTGSCFLIFRIALSIFPNRAPALGAALLYAVYFKVISLVAQLFAEPFYIFLLLGFLWFFLISFRKPYASFPAGVLLGIAALTRAVILLFPLVVCGLYVRKLRTRSLNTMVLFLVGFLPLVTAIYLRNYAWTGRIFFSTGGGEFLYTGTRFDYGINFFDEQQRMIQEIKKGFSPQYSIEDDAWLRSKAIDIIFKNPGAYLKRAGLRMYIFWAYPNYSTKMMAFKTMAFFAFNLFVIVFALYGFYRAKTKSVFYQPFLWMILYYYVIHILLHAHSRYSLPLFPILFMFASFGLVEFVQNIRSSEPPDYQGITT